MVFSLLSSDITQESEGDQRTRKRVICSRARGGGSTGLISN